jgi:hypothetical protein
MDTTALVHSALAVIHALAGAAWLGAMVYSLFVLHPRAHAYFPREAEFESFITAVSHGARRKVLTGLALIGLSGAALALVRWPESPAVSWLVLLGAKVVLFAAALGLFVYVSWRMWPARVFAVGAEVPQIQKAFRRVGLAMVTLAALGMTFGVLMHTW